MKTLLLIATIAFRRLHPVAGFRGCIGQAFASRRWFICQLWGWPRNQESRHVALREHDTSQHSFHLL